MIDSTSEFNRLARRLDHPDAPAILTVHRVRKWLECGTFEASLLIVKLKRGGLIEPARIPHAWRRCGDAWRCLRDPNPEPEGDPS